MKTFIAFTTAILVSLVCVAQADAMSKRGVALKTLAAHSASAKHFGKAKFSSSFVSSINAEGSCVENMIDGIDGSSMTEDEKSNYGFSVAVLFFSDYLVAASKDRKAMVKGQSLALKRKSARLSKLSSSKSARRIASSLSAHAIMSSYFARGVDIDFCAVETAIDNAGGYTAANIETAFESNISPELIDWAEETTLDKYGKVVERAQSLMRKVRPKIKSARIDNYGDVAVLGLLSAPLSSKSLSMSSASVTDVDRALEIAGL